MMLVCCHLLETDRCRTGRSVQSCHSTDWGQLERLCCIGLPWGTYMLVFEMQVTLVFDVSCWGYHYLVFRWLHFRLEALG